MIIQVISIVFDEWNNFYGKVEDIHTYGENFPLTSLHSD